MAYFTVSEQVDSLFNAGAGYALNNLYHGPQDAASAYAYLQSHYNQGNFYSRNALVRFITRYQQALDAAASLRRRPKNPLDISDIPGSSIIPEAFQFQVVWTFIDVQSGRQFTKLIWVNSNTNLTRDQVLANAQRQADRYVDQGGATYGPKAGKPVENSGLPGRIMAVYRKAPS